MRPGCYCVHFAALNCVNASENAWGALFIFPCLRKLSVSETTLRAERADCHFINAFPAMNQFTCAVLAQRGKMKCTFELGCTANKLTLNLCAFRQIKPGGTCSCIHLLLLVSIRCHNSTLGFFVFVFVSISKVAT